jgi:hypothetical protein
MTSPQIIAVYRVLYGEDFIQESIRSILPHVDQVIVVKAEKPWGDTEGVTYKGNWVSWPDVFDDTRKKISELNEPRVKVVDDYWPTPKGQLTHIVNDLILPSLKPQEIVFIEPDHVFSKEQASKAFEAWKQFGGNQATTRQIEHWKNPFWMVPERPNRTSVVFHRINGRPMGETGFNGASDGIHRLPAHVNNFGFCISERSMYWKHLTSLAFSRVVGDSPPNESWYENKWLSWNPVTNNRNLEISLGYEWTIPYAIPCSRDVVPESVCRKFHLDDLTLINQSTTKQ